MSSERVKSIARNRRAYHNFEFIDTYEAGLVLTGTEIKSLRDGKVSLAEAYGRTDGREVYLLGMEISPYWAGNQYNHIPRRKRKLLLHKREIYKIAPQLLQKGLTLVPLRLYFRDGWAKLEITVARGRKVYDKRQVIKSREQEREIQRAMRRNR